MDLPNGYLTAMYIPRFGKRAFFFFVEGDYRTVTRKPYQTSPPNYFFLNVFYKSDFDDNAANMVTGGFLKQLQTKFPSGFQIWDSNNTDFKTLAKLFKEYAYMPFSDIEGKKKNVIYCQFRLCIGS